MTSQICLWQVWCKIYFWSDLDQTLIIMNNTDTENGKLTCISVCLRLFSVGFFFFNSNLCKWKIMSTFQWQKGALTCMK